MKHEIDYNQLFQIEQDLHKVMTTQPGLSILLHGKIQMFYQQAANHIEKMKAGFTKIQLKYINDDGKGAPKIINTPAGRKFDFKPAVTDFKSAAILTSEALIDAYDKEMSTWGSQFKVTIIF